MPFIIREPDGGTQHNVLSYPSKSPGLYIIIDGKVAIFRGINKNGEVGFHLYEPAFTTRYLILVQAVSKFILNPEDNAYPEYEIGWLSHYQNPRLRNVNSQLDKAGYTALLCLEVLDFPKLDKSLFGILKYSTHL